MCIRDRIFHPEYDVPGVGKMIMQAGMARQAAAKAREEGNEQEAAKQTQLAEQKMCIRDSPIIAPINVMELFIKPLSLCMRLFGNVLGAFVIMELLKIVVPLFVPVVFSCYFDIFDGLIQAYVFVFLTGMYIEEAVEEA